MSELDSILDQNRTAVQDFIASAERCDAVWRTPRAPGKWSPSQLSEHVARSLDSATDELSGRPGSFPKVPALLRPAVRTFLLKRVLKTGAFPKAKTNKPMNPETGPASPALARARLQEALGRLENACREKGGADARLNSLTFGSVSVGDYVRFQTQHTRHHGRQFPELG